MSDPNIALKFREAFGSYTTNAVWNETKASGDLIMLDGNAVSSSYLVISKDPLTAGQTSYIETQSSFLAPFDMAIGFHMSQRVLGQEAFIELTSTEAPLSDIADIAISAIQQATTTLTVTTTTAHGLYPGARIGIRGCSDPRMNYPALVIATVPSTTQFTVTAGPGGTLASVTAGPFASGFVFYRQSMSRSPNGASLVFENVTATNASAYVRANGSTDVLPSGTLVGNHSLTTQSTASVAAISAARAYAFQPTTEFRLSCYLDSLRWSNTLVDGVASLVNISKRTQVVPKATVPYKLRIRATNNASLTIPVAQIVSVSKSGSTTATVTTDVPHGLTTADLVVGYGVNSQTNFANLAVATAVASVPTSTTFTIIWGASATTTSYGGFISRVNGGVLQQGVSAVVAQSISRTSNVVTIVGNTTWAPGVIGDYVNLIGCRDIATGASLGLDGTYRIQSFATTSLVLEPIGSAPTGTDVGSTNCGGGIIKRTDVRISYADMLSFTRKRVEISSRPTTDLVEAVPVVFGNTTLATTGTTTATQGTAGTVGAGWFVKPDNLLVNDIVSAALTVTTTTAAVTPVPVGGCAEFNIIVTAVSGSTPTLDTVVQESDDTGTNYYDIYHFPRITATGAYRSPVIPLSGNRIRYVQTVAGSTPSFTRALNRVEHLSVSNKPYRQFFDRSITLTSLNSVTPTFYTNGAQNVQLVANIGTAVAGPVLQIEGSDDFGATWYAVGAPLTAVASSTVQLTVNNITADALRVRVSTAGNTVVAGYLLLRAFG